MSLDRDRNDDTPPNLSSAEYRAKLLTKLNCLIAVLEVAIAKITRSMDLPGADEKRLVKIRVNLENTLSICHRAKETLESGLVKPRKPSKQGFPPRKRDRRMSYRDYVELSSIEEYRKFKSLKPITLDEIASADVQDLVNKLMEH